MYVCVGKFVWLMVPLCVLISCLRNNKPYREVDKAWNGRHTNPNEHTSLQENLKALQEKVSEQSLHMLTHAYSLIRSPVYTLPYSSVRLRQAIFHNQFLHCDGNADSLMSCGCGRIAGYTPGFADWRIQGSSPPVEEVATNQTNTNAQGKWGIKHLSKCLAFSSSFSTLMRVDGQQCSVTRQTAERIFLVPVFEQEDRGHLFNVTASIHRGKGCFCI